MISPSVYFACKKMKIPVVQSLYNPRYMCIAGSLNRNGIVCEKCVGLTFPRYGVLFKCYRKSLILSFLVAITYFIHKSIKTFDWGINLFINATHFYHEKFIEAGINEKKMVVKPHFVFSEPFCYSSDPSDYVVYVGRLDPEKGIHTLLNAWIKLKDIPLKIRGAGQLTPQVLSAKDHYNLPIEIIENLTKEDLTKLIKSARFLVFPSEGLYETFGMVIIEAFACGTPVISSQIGVMCEIIKEKETGLFFKPGNSKDLADKVRWAFSNKEEMIKMGENARIEYQTKYTSEINYKMMMEIYSRAMIKI
jgi:glycosyltransferase involved in cell wall biosynthesis